MACTVESERLGVLRGLEVKSKDSDSSIYYYGSVPYALAPVEEWRFRRPRPLPQSYRYHGTYTGNTPVCPQPEWLGSRQEKLWDEDCLRLNIYIPAGKPPSEGWPVFFYIHGGFLQWGNPNMAPEDIAPLLTETAFRCIIVQPAYRLNAFGFLASHELQAEAEGHGHTAGNNGFWDQRAALEWTHANIGDFGGNPRNITVGGYSAGAHSTFQQLAHELYFVPADKAIIRRAIMWSNSPGIQPKDMQEQQKQFDELLSALGISLGLSASEKLKKLRQTPARDIIDAQAEMKITDFRATTDNSFISAESIAHINSGDFARRMKSRGIKLMNGECQDEHNLYRAWRTAKDSYDGLYTRLCADYPERAVQKLLRYYCGPSQSLPPGYTSWQDLFGHAYANLQVHCIERGFHNKLSTQLQPGRDLLRYRIEWRAGCAGYPPEWGVTHATDMAIWFWYPDLTDEEKKILKPWNEAFARFVKGEHADWGTKNMQEMRRLRPDGQTDILKVDEKWEEGLHVWKLVNGSDDKPQL
ncbi:Alpha/Beta hydrolase protein [Truncatella angustata]|uniref:Carboxylic ester hydrolase n=1 Tax=Truncatella angustata TaxID=152316 RepID=A0A9P8ULA1_9PEZI|nr:Alpha/Beta hydrolase protein [Truncatella angustata]KAH6654284.1 Alpha/Beta hydrolase protein [Truncatella angustata]